MHTLGTVVYLDEGTTKLMIIGRGVDVYDDEMEQQVRYDYVACEYPVGIDPENAIFFNDESIDKVLFKGFSDEDEERFQEAYKEWNESNPLPKKQL